jgi:hypothetical protein
MHFFVFMNSQGSVIVDFQANFSVTSNITAVHAKAEILAHNGSKNTKNFIFQAGPEVYGKHQYSS